ncbi:hypothetical protein [Kitasatospora sp. NPDC090091]
MLGPVRPVLPGFDMLDGCGLFGGLGVFELSRWPRERGARPSR